MFAFAPLLVAVLSAIQLTNAACATGGIPDATETISNSEVIEIAEGESFDGAFARYDRGSGACSGQSEGDWEDAVFYLHEGATLSNVIIGADQAEGVHCTGSCSLINVWFEDVCEDAISIKNDVAGGVTLIQGGGAYSASDKVVQHNGCGTVQIQDFYVEDYGKLYRSCGNCDSQCTRTVEISGVTAVDGGELAGINDAYGDSATITDSCYDTENACVLYDGCEGDCEPEKIGTC